MKTSQSRQVKRASAEQLSDQRYLELLRSASTFFAAAEYDAGAQRASVIDDIKKTMAQYGLTVDDLM
ncbi:MAG: hypothetical protein CVU36_25005 [Betaproteobacteria bacterium HGW-Betaproteobacteria-9]|jgi:hypothetical protein|nr:hypothetical protein [Hydrogenophaga sp.]PKO26222.1 MAG: hypothetical protein CVU36_25005 [Betaproteobacteria bacterium HGW-Betaproteobacteria-9]